MSSSDNGEVITEALCVVIGRYCEVQSSYCQSIGNTACQNGATCVNKDDGYLCNCAAGFTGMLCLLSCILSYFTVDIAQRAHNSNGEFILYK